MKTNSIVIIVVFLVLIGAGVGAFLYFDKKKKAANNLKTEDKVTEPEKKETKKIAVSNNSVLEMQKQINSLLPPGYARIDEDGILGPKTKSAWDMVNNLKATNKLPEKTAVNTDTGIVHIDTSAIYENMKNAGKSLLTLSPLGIVSDIVTDLIK